MATTTTRHRQPRFALDEIHYRNLSELSRHTGFPLRTIQRWRTSGIPRNSADELAVRLGLHPANIWHTWWCDTKHS